MDNMNLFDFFKDVCNVGEGFESMDETKQETSVEVKQEKDSKSQKYLIEENDEELENEEEDESLDEALEEEDEPETKKTSKSKTSKKKEKKEPDENTQIMLPVTVKSSTFSFVIDGFGYQSLGQIYSLTLEEGYLEVACKQNCVYDPGNNVLYILDKVSVIDDKDNVLITENEPVNVMVGGLETDILGMSYFPGMETAEIGLEDVAEMFEKHYPAFLGSTYAYDAANKVVVPNIAAFKEMSAKESYKKCILYSENKSCEEKNVADFMVTELDVNEKFVTVRFVEDGYKQVRPVFELAKGAKQLTVCLNGTSKKKLEKKLELYKLPLTVWLANMGMEHVLTPDHFDGKEKVDKEDIRSLLAGEYAIFRKKDKKMDVQYVKSVNRLAVNISSSTKGAFMASAVSQKMTGKSRLLKHVTSREEFISLLAGNAEVCCTYSEPGYAPLRLENVSIGRFVAEEDSLRNLSHLRFQSKLPKIPSGLLETVIADFRRDLSRETVIQIYWNKKTRSYYLVRPQIEDASKVHVSFLSKFRGENNVLYMTIHSHNTMPAIFSGTDNEDECYTGLFGVIGTLDKEPSMCFRAGMEGIFCNLEKGTLFEE